MGKPVLVAGGIRTPFVRAWAECARVPAWELGRCVAAELLARLAVRAGDIDEVIFGCVAQPSDSANIARVISLRAGIPESVPALTVGRNCASGLEAVALAAERIASGRASMVLAGGVESMSRIPLEYPTSFSRKMFDLRRAKSWLGRARGVLRFRPRDFVPAVALERGLTDPTCGENMGVTAERLAREFRISREEQDRFALESHRRAVASRALLADEIAPICPPPDYERYIEGDNGPREAQSLEGLARLRPVFDRRFGTVTAGNACGISDGAVALLLVDEAGARRLGRAPLGKIRAHAFRGCDPKRMGLGPLYATPPALAAAGVTLADFDVIEINEAFAAQVLACRAAFTSAAHSRAAGAAGPIGDLDPARTNIHGGAIALGHPVGATGARLVLTVLAELRRRGGGLGLATLCIGGGQGGSMVVEGFAA